ncbi:hypothetical protein MBH78_10270 [Oceanimonas sp. NS1]|nr:hypothetical protein [Oceanimonas sp. NS1]
MHISSLQNDYYQFDPARQQLIGENFRRRYRLGDKIRVKVMAVNLDERKIDFELVEEGPKAEFDGGKGAKNLKSRKRAKPTSGKGGDKAEKGEKSDKPRSRNRSRGRKRR